MALDKTPDPCYRLALPTIRSALQDVSRGFAVINDQLASPRDPIDTQIIDNMIAGYAYVDRALAERTDFFRDVRHLLELNALVLCGADPASRAAHVRHLRATEECFYDDRRGGVRDVVEWIALHKRDSVWMRAAGVYIRVLSEPQLFIEGNHRTGALLMSYLLAREGRPPFVLTVDNAREYFDPSTLIKKTRKSSVSMMFRMPGIKRRFADFLRKTSRPQFLATVPTKAA